MKHSGLQTYKRLLKATKPYISYFVIGVIGTALLSAIDASFMGFIKPIIDLGFVKRQSSFIHMLPFLVIAIFLARGIASFLSDYYIRRVSRSVVRDFRCQLFAKLQRLPAYFFDAHSSGHVISTILYNVEQVAEASSSVLITVLRQISLFVGLVIVMLVVNWRVSLLFILIVPFIIGIVRWSSRRMRRLGTRAQEAIANVTHITGETVDGYRVVRLHGGEAHQNKKFMDAANSNFHRELKIGVTSSISSSVTQTLFAIPLAIALAIATSPFFHVTAGSFASIIAAMVSLLQPVRRLTGVNSAIQRGIAGAESIFAMLDEPDEIDTGEKTLSRAKGDITFDQVSFHYRSSERPILKALSFQIPAGKTFAVVGKSGGGKTTLVSLLPRFYEIVSGSIKIDEVDIRDYRLKDLRHQFAFVSQNTVLFDDTVFNNIAYGIQNPDREAVLRAANAAYAMEFIDQLPQGLDTIVGENGVLLSGGQRQRIAIARALLKDAPILILDEATSSLDVHAERQIQAALETLMKQRTSIVIAHRLSTIENADQIVVMSQGCVVEIGDHATLLAKQGDYAQLYQTQFKE